MPHSTTLIRLAGTALITTGAILLAACTAPSASTPAPTPAAASLGSAPDGILPGYRDQTALEFSPLIITSLAGSATPVKGSDGRYWVAYELSVFNDAPRAATLTGVQTLESDPDGSVIHTRDQSVVAANMLIAGDAATALGGSAVIPAGRTGILVLRDAYDSADEIPDRFTHRISATYAAATTDQGHLAAVYPDELSQVGGPITIGLDSPVLIGAPLTGADWVANNGLATDALNSHSNVVIPVGGRVNAAERYAVDFIRLAPEAMATYRGDPGLNASYLAFGQPLLAVADATVVRVVSDQADIAPRVLPQLERLDLATGNAVVLDLGDGVFALYAHMQQDSATVQVGDRVHKGEVIGRLGNSGNTSEPHLHFQLQRGPLMDADNVAWVIDRFTSSGAISPDGESIVPGSGPRTTETPVGGSISDFDG